MAIHWQVKFKSLRADRLYTVSIYDDAYTGSAPIQLKGAADPFYTQEDDDDNIFTPIRTQSGYIRIIDDGGIDWRDIIPSTDTARPVTLTHVENNQTVTDWIGFIQAQNFGYTLFEIPVERELPVQCPLTVVSGIDINYTQTTIQNFASLLKTIVDSIPVTSRPTRFFFQGGADAQSWLLKRIDWRNFTSLDDDNNIEAKYSMQKCLEKMCQFWGWTVRIKGDILYFVSFDDQTERTFLQLSESDLTTMAAGTTSGTTTDTFLPYSSGQVVPLEITGDFADTDNDDYQNRGYDKVIITADANEADEDIIDPFSQDMVAEMNDSAWGDGYVVHGDNYVHYTKDIIDASQPYLEATAVDGKASFNIMAKNDGSGNGFTEVGNVIHIKKTADGSTGYITFKTKYEHSYQDGFFRLLADTYRDGNKFESGGFYAGDVYMKMRLGIGRTRSAANWWNGKEWQSSITTFDATVGNKKPELFTIYVNTVYDIYESSVIEVANQKGYLYIDILGISSLQDRFPDIDGEKVVDFKDFRVEFTRNSTVARQQFPNSGWWDIKPKSVKDKYKYKATNNNAVRSEYTEENIFASDKKMDFGYGIVLNADNTCMSTVRYNGGNDEHPEQHKANRIAGYWATSKRKIEANLLTHNGIASTPADSLTPRYLVKIDGTVMYPISFSRRWRDDIAELVFMENNG